MSLEYTVHLWLFSNELDDKLDACSSQRTTGWGDDSAPYSQWLIYLAELRWAQQCVSMPRRWILSLTCWKTSEACLNLSFAICVSCWYSNPPFVLSLPLSGTDGRWLLHPVLASLSTHLSLFPSPSSAWVLAAPSTLLLFLSSWGLLAVLSKPCWVHSSAFWSQLSKLSWAQKSQCLWS